MPLLGHLYEHYEPSIRRLPQSRPLTDVDVLQDAFLLDREGRLDIYYAPMDWLRPHARVAVVGITPGKDTMVIAYQTVLDGLRIGRPPDELLDSVKRRASFSGFRPLLTGWLEWLGVHQYLGVENGAALLEGDAPLVHPTSVVRYPAFVDGRNYSGRNPDLVRAPLLRRYLYEVLAPELAEIPDALVIPLGEKVADALRVLSDDGLVDLDRCLVGFPHPSGNNGSRMQKWSENRVGLKQKTADWFEARPLAGSS
jgi:hypothetical protein